MIHHKDFSVCCNQSTEKRRMKFNDGGKRYAVILFCSICKTRSSQITGGNIGDTKHTSIPWLEEDHGVNPEKLSN